MNGVVSKHACSERRRESKKSLVYTAREKTPFYLQMQQTYQSCMSNFLLDFLHIMSQALTLLMSFNIVHCIEKITHNAEINMHAHNVCAASEREQYNNNNVTECFVALSHSWKVA